MSELAAIYDALADRAEKGEVIVASNSWGIKTGSPPPPPDSHELFVDALNRAIETDVLVVFSAGNYHDIANGQPRESAPTTIWLDKGRSDVLTVGTCDLDNNIWYYSSRGPGQFYGTNPLYSAKPDVVAPTPRNGKILYGNDDVIMPVGWGTSGAAPQVAGLLAPLLSSGHPLDRDGLFDIVRQTARSLGLPPECQGHGMIDCNAALRSGIELGLAMETRSAHISSET